MDENTRMDDFNRGYMAAMKLALAYLEDTPDQALVMIKELVEIGYQPR